MAIIAALMAENCQSCSIKGSRRGGVVGRCCCIAKLYRVYAGALPIILEIGEMTEND